jgi:lysophospholipase L1-like esterase
MNMKNNRTVKLLTALVLLVAAMSVNAAEPFMVQHPWAGKKVAYFGDSITDPRNSASKNKYWTLLEQWLGITPYVYAVSGRQWDDIPRQADKLMAEHGDTVDAILILMGTNDYNNGVPLGRWYIEKDEEVMYGHGKPKQMVMRKRQYMEMTDSTYRGRINIAMDKLKRMYPTKQIIVMTPIHRQNFHANDKNWQCSEDYTNQCGEYLQAYVDATKEVANVWAVPVIDMNSLCGLYPMIDEHAQFYRNAETDRLHPNDKGHERMARVLMYQLLAQPIF